MADPQKVAHPSALRRWPTGHPGDLAGTVVKFPFEQRQRVAVHFALRFLVVVDFALKIRYILSESKTASVSPGPAALA